MSDLAGFLAARLDEDEAAAVACESAPDPAAAWHVAAVPEHGFNLLMSESDGHVVIHGGGFVDDAEAAHIARWDPARVLREVDAKRKILALHRSGGTFGYVENGQVQDSEFCAMCGSGTDEYPEPWPCETLQALAAVYSDHPDYDPEWKTTP